MSKYLLKFIKYILSSSKDWTGVGHLNYRDSTIISRNNILSIESVLKNQTQLQPRRTIKVPAVMKVWACWSLVTAKIIFVSETHRGILIWICIPQLGLRYGIRGREWNFLRMGHRSIRQSEDRIRNSAFTGSLINNDDLVHERSRLAITLKPMLTGARSLTAKAEIEEEPRKSSWAA